MTILPPEFYQNTDVLHLSQNLLGKYLFTNFHNHLTGGMIIETEAYQGIHDKASHAFGNRRTKRTATMYQAGGICYIYMCYGIHFLLNVVTNIENVPDAVLIRAIKPEFGIDEMLRRRNKKKVDKTLTNGPGAVCQALGIHIKQNGLPLNQPPIWIEDRVIRPKKQEIISSPRIGVDYAGEHAHLPWRFRYKI